ncbi:MAG: glycosyltransferase [Acidobacteriia bacterium]|nr:glycosyltransferase [Methyloceanibacter sp.]MCL6491333.1 glycosyltransferase [Terriglobia bacterium]
MNASYAEELARLARQRAEYAKAALDRAQEAAARGAEDTAAAWLERAHRLAPKDAFIQMLLAGKQLQRDPARAGDLFRAACEAFPFSRTAWLGLAVARRLLGDAEGAAEALQQMLSSTVGMDPALAEHADLIAAEAGVPGWCALTVTGEVTFRVRTGNAHAVRLMLDGKEIAPGPSRSGLIRLPPSARKAKLLTVTVSGRNLLGSPLALGLVRAADGFVEAKDGGITGWAWHPADPDRDPVLEVRDKYGTSFRILARAVLDEALPNQPLSRPRRIEIPRHRLKGFRGLIHVLAEDGQDLVGSPLDPIAEAESAIAIARAAARGFRRAAAIPSRAAIPADIPVLTPPAKAAVRLKQEPITVVIPVYRGVARTRACLNSVFASIPSGTQVIIIDDASPEPEMAPLLEEFAAKERVLLLKFPRNRGFPAAVNAGLSRAEGDVVVLNSDTLVAPGWLDRLRAAAWSAPRIGTVTPFSNAGSILSYPSPTEPNPVPDLAETKRLAALAHKANAGLVVEIPTAVGFCMYIRGDCLAEVGLFREDVFAQGYGEENDFCLRARHLGWRHVAAPGVFVAHVGGVSFGPARAQLMARNQTLLERLHPGYSALIAAWHQADPLAKARFRLDAARFRALRPRQSYGAVLFITHDRGGGVEHLVSTRAKAARAAGLRPLVLCPLFEGEPPEYRGLCRIEESGAAERFPNLRFAMPAEKAALVRFLGPERIERVEVHHLLGHDHSVLELAQALQVPYEMFVHDYAAFCPRISLLGREGRYCGEPEPRICADCVADVGWQIEEKITPLALRRRSAADFAAARRVVCPSHDAARRLQRHFPEVRPLVLPWETDLLPPSQTFPPAAPVGAEGKARVAVIGAIGPEKGYEVLLGCARNAGERALPLEFVVVGHTIDDARLLATGAVFITGPYEADEAVALIARQRAQLAFFPSVVPETWCFALTEAWQAGLEAVAFDLGAQAERIRARGGLVLPLGTPSAEINNALLAVAAKSLAKSFTNVDDPVIRRGVLPAFVIMDNGDPEGGTGMRKSVVQS